MVGWGDQRCWSEAGHCAVPPSWRQNQSGYLHLWKPNSVSVNSCVREQQALLSVIKFKRGPCRTQMCTCDTVSSHIKVKRCPISSRFKLFGLLLKNYFKDHWPSAFCWIGAWHFEYTQFLLSWHVRQTDSVCLGVRSLSRSIVLAGHAPPFPRFCNP